MSKSAEKNILRCIALVLYGYFTVEGLLGAFRGHLSWNAATYLLMLSEITMFVSLIFENHKMTVIALAGLTSGYLLRMMMQFRSMIAWSFNILDAILIVFYALYAAVCVYIIRIELFTPDNIRETRLRLLFLHRILFGLYALYVLAMGTVIKGVLPRFMSSVNVFPSGMLGNVAVTLRATLTDGLLATCE